MTIFFVICFAVPTKADIEQGLNVDVYTYSPEYLPERQPYTLCKDTIETSWTSVTNINHDWYGDIVAGCQGDFVLVHYYGYITMPTTGDVIFQSLADDGFYMSIGNETVIDNWWLKGCSGGQGIHYFEQGISQAIDVWWYEYGGGACNMLYTYTDELGYQPLPDEVFTRNIVPVVVEPTPEPTPTETPTPDPTPTEEPTPDPTPTEDPKPQPEPEPQPEQTPEPVVEPQPPVEPPIVLPEPVVEPTKEEVMAELLIEAQEDDIVVPEELASVPVIGAVAEALADALNYFGNAGADMTPEVRDKAKKVVVAALVAGQVAQVAATASATAAAAATRRVK